MAFRTTLTIDLAAIRENVQIIKAHANGAFMMAVLKANAYGAGAREVTRAVLAGGVDAIGVSTATEATELRSFFQGDLYVLGACFEDELETLLRLEVVIPVSSVETLHFLQDLAKQLQKQVSVHCLIDSGMGLLGVHIDQALSFVEQAVRLPNIHVRGCFSHFPNAFSSEDSYTPKQLAAFKTFQRELLALLTERHIEYLKKFKKPLPSEWVFHIANSDGAHNYPEASLGMIRTGLNLYGLCDPAREQQAFKRYTLKPVLTFSSRVVAIRYLPAGQTIGYGLTHRLHEPTWVATVAAGYADGVPFALSNSMDVLIKEQTYPIIGRVSMDYFTLSLGQNPHDVRVGDTVVLFGKKGKTEISVNAWATLKRTHAYDIMTSIGPRVKRVYLSDTPAKTS